MTEEVTELVSNTNAALTVALEYVKTAESFVVEQAPLFIQELLAYNLAYSVFWCVFCALFIGVVVFGVVKLFKITKGGDMNEPRFFGSVFAVFVASWPTIGLFENLFTAMKITLAPRLFLLEELSRLIR